MPQDADDSLGVELDDDSIDDEPIPARRDTRIFSRKKDDEEKKDDEDNKKEDFDEDVFV